MGAHVTLALALILGALHNLVLAQETLTLALMLRTLALALTLGALA